MAQFLIRNPDTAMVYSDFTKINKNGQEMGVVAVKPYSDLIHRNCIGPSFLYTREVYVRVGEYREDALLAEDYDYWLRVSATFIMKPLHRNLYVYRGHHTR